MNEPIESVKQALLLDFDGVVVATERLHFESWNAAFAELLGIRITGSHKQLIGLTLTEIYDLWCQAANGRPLSLTPEMEQRLLARKTELFFSLGEGRLQPLPGVVGLVHRARALGWYVMIVSRSRRIRLLRTLEMAGLPAIFDLVMGCEDAVEPTTDRKEHARAAAPFGIDPACCVVVEDSATGVWNARACGIGTVIGLTTSLDRATLLAAGAHLVVDYLAEVQLERSAAGVLEECYV